MSKYLILSVILLACVREDKWTVSFGQGDTINVKVLVEEYELSQGLMYHRTLAQDSGFLFLFPEPGIYSFWMKNTLIPLAIAFIDSNNQIITIDSMYPEDTILTIPPVPIIMALETNLSWFQDHQIRPGMVMKLNKIR